MTDGRPPLFDFTVHADAVDSHRDLIRAFAQGEPFRSAMVEELELDEAFHRRPVRPEDLSFIRFRNPVRVETVERLPFLASQRLLLSINETAVARFPKVPGPDAHAQFADFYGEHNQILGARIRPFLEDFAFSFLSAGAIDPGIGGMTAALMATVQEETRFWTGQSRDLLSRDYLEEGVRFILIQNWSLAASKRSALARAVAAGFFEPVRAADRPALDGDIPGDAAVEALARRCGALKREHSYWQFYLSTSLARCNLLHALARRPDRALALYGAAFDAEAHWLAFGCLVGQAGQALGTAADGDIDVMRAVDGLAARFGNMLRSVEDRFGADGLAEVARGLGASRRLGASARADLGAQLRWLSSVDQFRGFARDIDRRIHAECPDIDRETFVEPREMCSTTHVHDDHRLVVIESGDMVFWGNLGMNLKLKPGEMVLVPEGRLHGSSIESSECIYHQPIIPGAWIAELIDGEVPAATAA